MRDIFQEQLRILNHELIKMGTMCETAISSATEALEKGDADLAEKTFSMEDEIHHMERTIESICLKLLLKQQPVAGDLREVSAALKMITDLGRIGTQAADIAEIIRFLDGRCARQRHEIGQMAQETIKMVTESLAAFVRRDVLLAEETIAHDDVVDAYFDKAKNTLIQMVVANPEDGACALDLLMIAKYFERIGDHAVNIAQWVVFSVTGKHESENR